jgi:hypothetical protein
MMVGRGFREFSCSNCSCLVGIPFSRKIDLMGLTIFKKKFYRPSLPLLTERKIKLGGKSAQKGTFGGKNEG